MTKEDLRQIYYLNREIKMWQEELARIQCRSIAQSPQITGMPRGAGQGDPVASMAADIADIEVIIRGKLAEIQIQRKRILEYIDTVEDSLIRQILFYRHVSCMSWTQVAMEIGGDNTPDGVRKIHDRFLAGY